MRYRHKIDTSFLISLLFLALIVYATVTLNLPNNNSFTNGTNDTINFTFNFTRDLGEFANCTLIINSVQSGIYHNVSNGTAHGIFANYSLSDGYKYWNVSCVNFTGTLTNTTATTRTLIVDRTKPNVTLAATPVNNSNSSSTTQDFTWTAIDNLATSFQCNLTGNSNILSSSSIIKNNTAWTVSTTLISGLYRWNVSCFDNATNMGSTGTRNLTIDTTKPNVSTILPINADEDLTIVYNATAYDWPTGISGCDLYINGTLNGSMALNASNTFANKSVIIGTPGTYVFLVNCTDIVGNINDTVTTSVKINDNTTPQFNQWVGYRVLEYGDVFTLQVNATDNAGISRYKINDTGNFTINTLTGLVNATLLPVGNYTINISANDTSNNQNHSIFNITVQDTLPHMTVLGSSISTTSGTVTFTIDQTANYSYNQGGTIALGGTLKTSTTFAQSHTITLTGLSPDTWNFYNITYCDKNNNCAINGSSFKTSAVATTATSTGHSGGGGGYIGPAMAAPAAQTTSIAGSLTKVWDSIAASQEGTFKVDVASIPVTNVVLSVNNAVTSPSIKVSSLNSKPSTTPDVPTTPYTYLDISKANLADSNIKSGSIDFKVAKTWLNTNNVLAEKVSLYRFSNSAWQKLSTTITSQDSNYVYYSASTPGFSYFAIAGEKAEVKQPEVKQETQPAAPASQPTLQPEQKTSKSDSIIIGAISIFAVLIIYIMLRNRRKRSF